MATAKEMPLRRMYSKRTARTLAEQIADTVAFDIVNGNYAAGEKILETELAERLNVSRGPVRDALALLESNMLVTIKPRSYTKVNRLTVTELEHVFTFRAHVLGIASRYAAMNRTPEDMTRICASLDEFRAVVKSGSKSFTSTAFPGSQVWDCVIDASHSHVVRQGCLHFTGANIWATAVEEKISSSAIPRYQKQHLKLWEQLVDQVDRQDADAAQQTGIDLVGNNWQLFQKAFAKVFPAV